jgi:hypothetical protein
MRLDDSAGNPALISNNLKSRIKGSAVAQFAFVLSSSSTTILNSCRNPSDTTHAASHNDHSRQDGLLLVGPSSAQAAPPPKHGRPAASSPYPGCKKSFCRMISARQTGKYLVMNFNVLPKPLPSRLEIESMNVPYVNLRGAHGCPVVGNAPVDSDSIEF